MKKKLIDFSKVAYRNTTATELRMRHNTGAHFKSGGKEEDEDEDEDEERTPSRESREAALLTKIEKRVKKQLKDYGITGPDEIKGMMTAIRGMNTKVDEKTGKEVESPLPLDALRELADETKGALPQIVAMGVRMKNLEDSVRKDIKLMDIRSQVGRWQEENKDVIAKISDPSIRGRELPKQMVIKIGGTRVASPMLTSTVNATASPYIGRVEVEPGVNDFLVLPNKFWDSLVKGKTNAPTYVWVNKTNRLGAAAFIGPGVAKPGVSFELVADTSVAKKIADSAKAGTELLKDIDGMTTFIEQELFEQVMLKVNSTLMTATASSTVPAGIQTLSQLYSFYTTAAANIKTTNPNYMDVIRAVVGAMRSGALQGDITIYINSIDAANMDISKAINSGVYLLPPFVTSNGVIIAGAKIIEDNNVPVGYFQAGFMKYYRILIYEGFFIDWGWEMDDFTKNLVTAIGEMRLHQFFNTIYTGAFMYDTFENVKTAITAA